MHRYPHFHPVLYPALFSDDLGALLCAEDEFDRIPLEWAVLKKCTQSIAILLHITPPACTPRVTERLNRFIASSDKDLCDEQGHAVLNVLFAAGTITSDIRCAALGQTHAAEKLHDAPRQCASLQEVCDISFHYPVLKDGYSYRPQSYL